MNLYYRIFFILLSTFIFISKAHNQTVNINGIPRDTSFTIHQTYFKQKKYFPQIQIPEISTQTKLKSYENITYCTRDKERDLHMNIYRPDNNNVYPALIMVHGGGWNSGDLTLQIPMAMQIASKGYVTIPVEYRLIPEAIYPAAVYDLKTAVKWLRSNVGKYGIDPEKIAISGCSAGGQLANLIGTTNGRKNYEANDELRNISATVQAVINIDGISDFTTEESISRAEKARESGETMPVDAIWLGGTYGERKKTWEEASPVYWVSGESAPVCFINSAIPRFHNGRDEMVKKLDALGIYSEIHTIDNTPHPFWLFYPWMQTTVNYAVNYLDKVFKVNSGPVQNPDSYQYIVAKDGSGNFSTVQEAINAVEDSSKTEVKILIRKGIYYEKILIPSSKTNVTLIGEDVEKTVLAYDDYASKKNSSGKDIGTSGSASIYIYADDFTAKNITFENSSGPVGQAVAVYVVGDRSCFFNCRLMGFQDTLYAASDKRRARQYFENCYIEGTTDFIFGSAVAWFENCTLFCKKNSYITAASTPEKQQSGYIFNNCTILAKQGLNSVYLGRPWRPYAMVAFMNTYLPAEINPTGWNDWGKESNQETARYYEFNNNGPGAELKNRAKWSRTLTKGEAASYTIEKVFAGEDNWNPAIITK